MQQGFKRYLQCFKNAKKEYFFIRHVLKLLIINQNFFINGIKNIKIKLIICSCIYLKIIIFLYQNKTNLIRPKISIFLPIYNKELYLKNCIHNLQIQTFKNIEIIAVNDGSTDDSLKLLKKLSKKDPRIKIINNDRNHGLLYSRAMGISNSTGEYLLNIDPDDTLINNNDLNCLYKHLKTKKYDMIIYLIKRIAVNKKHAKYFKYLDETQLKRTDYYITNKIVRKEIFIKAFNEFKEEIFDRRWNYHEDNIWNCLVRKYAKKIKILNKYIYSYKRNKDSLNIKKDNSVEIRNRFDRLKKLKKMNYNFGISMLLFSLKSNYKNYNVIKNNELKNHIIHILIDYINFFTKKSYIYNALNLFLNKLSEKKIIIFYHSTDENYTLPIEQIKFKKIMMKNKYVVPINCNNNKNIEDIKNFIFQKDVLIMFKNANFECKINNLLKSHKKNRIILFVNKIKVSQSYKKV